ncbi:MAG: GAF domain-containing sensor histidine kinase [Polyangiaceae bacterium]
MVPKPSPDRTSRRGHASGRGDGKPEKRRLGEAKPLTDGAPIAPRDETHELEARCADLDARLARAERTVKALRDVGLALGSTLDLDQLLELILGKIAELLEADRATLYLLDEQRGRLLSRIIIGAEARSIELPLGAGIAGQVAKHGHTIRIRDAYRDRRFSRSWDDVTGYRTRSILAAPMKNHVGRTIGVIQVLNKRPPNTQRGEKLHPAVEFDEFSLYDEELLIALATQAAVSIDNSRLFLSVIQKNIQLVETKEQLEHRVSDLKLLFELESAMARASTIEELARAVVSEAARACGAQAGGLMVDEGEEGVWLYFVDASKAASSSGRFPVEKRAPLPEVKRLSVRRGEGIIGQAMRSNEAQHMPASAAPAGSDRPPLALADGDLPESGPVSWRLGSILGLNVTSAIAMPLEGPNETPIGALALYNATRPGGFTQDARALLRLVSANASTAVRLFLSRAERERSERLTSIGRLLSGVMHDLRTPMSVINGYVQLMASTADEETRVEQAKAIAKQFDAIGAMQQEILKFARGERTTFIRRVFLSTFFGEVEQQIQRELAGTRVKLVMEIDEKGVARFDEGKMMRVINNLARNAIEAMGDRGGTLTISARIVSHELVITVSDTGKGIPEAIRKRLFQTFATSGKKGGTGLGLSIAKKIVEEHGGQISVVSGRTSAPGAQPFGRHGPGPGLLMAPRAHEAEGAKFVIRIPQHRRDDPTNDRADGDGAAPRAHAAEGPGAKRAARPSAPTHASGSKSGREDRKTRVRKLERGQST